MKRRLLHSILILATGSLISVGTAAAQTITSTPTAAPGVYTPGHPRVNQVNHREARQQRRINNGVNNGTINPNEARRLERGQAKVQRQEQHMLAKNDGHLTKPEQRHLNRVQNRQSKRIYNAKHNGK